MSTAEKKIKNKEMKKKFKKKKMSAAMTSYYSIIAFEKSFT